MSVAPGTKLGQYEVQDFIGQGAMGLVYRAYHTQLERIGAVKVMQAITPDVDTVARFRHEAQAIAKLRHPNIVDVYDFGEFEGTPYMIVEYVPGGSLASRINRGRLDQATALKYLRGIAAGLDYAHGHGIVHRDVKPANVLMTADDEPVLADFGLAKLLQGSSLRSMTGVTTGTPAYMAPEQVTGSRVGPAADRYSLATIAYEMLTGVIPFDGEALMELLYAQVHREPPAPSSREPSLGPQVDAVVLRGLAKDPAARWESATAFVDSLAAALKGAPAPGLAQTVVMPPQVTATVPLAGAAVTDRVAARPQPATVAVAYPSPNGRDAAAPAKPPRRRNRRLVLGIAAVLVLLLVLGVCAIAAQATTLAVTPSRATPGQAVTIAATHVPANQIGEIQLWSVVHTYPFRANAGGNVSLELTVPRDIALGDHVVKICWSNSCHKQAPLRVVAGLAQAQPTPVGNSTPATSPSPTPGATPSHGSTPPPTATPASTATPTSKPTPPPSTNPCPTPAPPAKLTASPTTVVVGGSATISGQNFTPGKTALLTYYLGSTFKRSWSASIDCQGNFSTTVTPGTLDIGTAKVTAGDGGGRNAYATFTVIA